MDLELNLRIGSGENVVDSFRVAADASAPVDAGLRQHVGRQLRRLVQRRLERQKHRQELLLVADEDGVRHDGQLALHRLLDRHRGNVLASGRDQQLLDTTCNNIVS